MPSPDPMPAAAPTAGGTVDRTGDESGGGAAAQGPIPAPVSAAGVAAQPLPPGDTPDAALGRRTLSTAFVRIGPDGYLTVERHGGRVVVLRDVTMEPTQYCGMQGGAGTSGKRYCGAYAEVAAAQPGGGPDPAVGTADPGVELRPTPIR